MSRLRFVAFLTALLAARAAGGAACSESPTGQQNCEVIVARDQNALPTPAPNYFKLQGNSATGAVAPTPAAGECVWGDSDATGTDDFGLRCAGTFELKRLVLDAGSSAAGTAPLKFTAGPLLSSVEPGAMEYYNNGFWLTNWYVRRTIVQAQEVITADVTVANTLTETTVFTQPHGANYLVVGKMEEIRLYGVASSLQNGNSNTLTVRLKYAGSTLGSFVVPEAVRSGVGWEMHIATTTRAIGAGTTSIQYFADFDLNGTATDNVIAGLSTGNDSTAAQPTTVTFQWSDADAGNTITVQQGRAFSIDDN